MILYKKDWNKYPTAIPDFKTRNESWVRMAAVFQKMGIENYYFHLALHNPLLQGIDPFSNDLTQDEIAMITTECSENPWYVLREIIRIPPVASPDPVPLKANRGNISLFWLFFNHITTMLIQPRQTGKSVSTDALMVTLFSIMTVNTDINLLTKDDSLRVKNIARLKSLIDLLPEYLNLKGRGDTWNTEKLTISRLGNTYHSNVAQASPKAALSIGRGMTLAINHIDEIAFIKNIDVTLPAMLAATSSARDQAKASGAPYGNIFTTTPGYLNSNEGRFAYKVYNESFRWSEKLFDCENEEDLVNTIRKNNPSGKVQVLLEFNHRQLGFTDEWLRQKIEEAMSDGEDAGADFLNIWAEGSMASPIDKRLLKVIKDSKIPDGRIVPSTHGYITRWYVNDYDRTHKYKNRPIVMGLDTSDAVGKDDIGMVIRDAQTGEVIATGLYNETNIIYFAEWLIEWLEEYPNLTMVIERRSSGVAIIDKLLYILPAKGINPFRRLFNWVTDEADTDKKKKEFLQYIDKHLDYDLINPYRKHFGYATAGSGKASRDNLYGNTFLSAIKYTGSVVRDPDLINQLESLTVRNNRIDHKSGGHDDLVIAWLLSYWFLTEGKNKKYYGIDTNSVLSTVVDSIIEEQGGREAILYKEAQIKKRKEIDELLAKLKQTKDNIKSTMISNKIRMMYKQLDKNIVQPFNVDTIIQNIELEKRKSNRYYAA